MYSVLLMILWKILEYSLCAAAVLTYIEIGPYGDTILVIVESFKQALMQIDWSTLFESLKLNIEVLIQKIWGDING